MRYKHPLTGSDMMDRRHFLIGSAATLGTLGAARVSLASSPNETIRVACVGLRSRGKAHLGGYPKLPNVTVAAICDIDDAVNRMRDGEFGDLYMARGLCFKWRDTIGRTAEGPVPAGVDYDLWLGPAPKRNFSKNRFHYNWHWFWDYGNGDLGNQGIHEVDVARWGLGVKYPTKVSAIGGHFMFDDDQETPNTIIANYEINHSGKKKIMV